MSRTTSPSSRQLCRQVAGTLAGALLQASFFGLWLVGLAFLAAPAGAEDGLDEVLARYAEARGGLERWRAVEALEVRGAFTSFSLREPFTRLHKRPGLYLFETVMNGARAVHGRDASGPWWIEPAFGPGAQRPPDPAVPQIERAAELEPVLLRASEKGHEVELLGAGDVDGHETRKLRVTLASGGEEVWHLDPATFLEVAIDSKVLDFTQAREPIDERAYFTDFRDVGGLVIPHRVEREYLSRHTVLEIEEVTVDPALGEERFAMPPEG